MIHHKLRVVEADRPGLGERGALCGAIVEQGEDAWEDLGNWRRHTREFSPKYTCAACFSVYDLVRLAELNI